MSAIQKFLFIYWTITLTVLWGWLFLNETIDFLEILFKRKKIFAIKFHAFRVFGGDVLYRFDSRDNIPASHYEVVHPRDLDIFVEQVAQKDDKFYPTITLRPVKRSLKFNDSFANQYLDGRKQFELAIENVITKVPVTYSLFGISKKFE